MPAPPNQTAATATVMTLDYAATLPDVDLATPAPNCDVWYAFTAPLDARVVGFWAYEAASANYTPRTTVWKGPAGSLVQVMDGHFADNVPCQFSVTPGESYYLRIRNSSGLTPAAGTSVAISALRPTMSAAPAGSILINDANSDTTLPAAVLDAATGEVLQFVTGMAAGEAGDVLPGGTVVLDDVDSLELRVYNAALEETSVLDYPANPDFTPQIRALVGSSSRFYVGHGGDGVTPPQVTTLNTDGVTGMASFGLVTWNLPGVHLSALAANAAETILYWSQQGTGLGAIHRYDLVNSVALSNLAAAIPTVAIYDLFVLADDTILASYVDISPNNFTVRHYSPAGAVLHTYNFGAAGTITPPRLARAHDGDVTFWVMFLSPSVPQTQYVQRVRVSDGAIVDDLHTVVFNRGVYAGTSAADNPRFGHSNSCPLLVPPPALPPPGPGPGPAPPTPATYATRIHTRRRLRTFPHLSQEQVWAFHQSLQIDMETGVGVSDPTAQGYDPEVLLRWSDDGGHTWSNVHTRSLGTQGAYRHRIFYRALGRSRDRIYELSMTDPVRANVIAGYIQAEAGVS
jgi:hypothetical protein